jgi:hypothetical protein
MKQPALYFLFVPIFPLNIFYYLHQHTMKKIIASINDENKRYPLTTTF